jgi:hypothetical protein
MAQLQVQERRSIHVCETVQLAEGETQIVIVLPEPVPQGKALDLRVEVSGNYQDAPPQA